jgi:uncharacterized protein YneF (UPF0154 family)
VSEQLLLQKGGNYIESYVPPSIVLNDKRKFVLVSHGAKDLYNVPQMGMATVNANEKSMPIMPPQTLTRETGFQDREYFLVETTFLARKGLMSQVSKNPMVTLKVSHGRPPVPYKVVNPDTVKVNGLPTDGKFIMPALNSKGPYPLKLNKNRAEAFAIPPKPKDGLEYATGEAQEQQSRTIIIIILVFLAIVGAIGYFGWTKIAGEGKQIYAEADQIYESRRREPFRLEILRGPKEGGIEHIV